MTCEGLATPLEVNAVFYTKSLWQSMRKFMDKKLSGLSHFGIWP